MTDVPPGDAPDFIPPIRRTEPLRAEREPEAIPTVTKRGLLEFMGDRARRRPEPRLGVALAAAGSAMAVVGAVTIGGDQLGGSGGSGDGSQFPGMLITLAVIAAGVILAARERTGPLAAAGVAASAIALPPFVVFMTFSKTSAPSFNTILLLSTLGWLAGYVLGPARGHTLYLGAALIGFWLWFIEVSEHLFSSPFVLFDLSGASSSTFGANTGPDATTIGTYTFGFGVVYLVVGRLLDRRERRGMATPFAFAGIVTLIIGIVALANDLEQLGTGLLLTLAGVALCYLGATESRRATNWIGALLVFIGSTLLVAYPFDNATSAFGVAELIAGAVVILLGYWIATQFHEPAETDAVLSRFYNVGSVQPSGPPPPPAGSVLS